MVNRGAEGIFKRNSKGDASLKHEMTDMLQLKNPRPKMAISESQDKSAEDRKHIEQVYRASEVIKAYEVTRGV